jgi:hypothetical protein
VSATAGMTLNLSDLNAVLVFDKPAQLGDCHGIHTELNQWVVKLNLLGVIRLSQVRYVLLQLREHLTFVKVGLNKKK